jgi:sporulation protein YlmC with PRC-barrel domain
MRTYLVGGLLAAALLSSTAIAQNTQTQTPAPAPNATTMQKGTHWRASKLIGVNIYNEQNEKLGDINEIILDKDAKVIGYVIGVGGFLGMGEHDILVEPSKIKFVNEPVRSASNTNTNTTAKKNTNTTTNTATNTTANPPPANANNANAPTNTRNASNTGSNRNDWYPDHGVLNATKDQLKSMPQFKYSTYNG